MGKASDIVLKDEPGRLVVRNGDRIHRRAEFWTPTVHALLDHLHTNGFPFVPKPYGVDTQGREVLSFIPGTSGAETWAIVAAEEGLVRFARLLRDYHAAARTFDPPPGAVWAVPSPSPGPGHVVCHNDFGPWNVVWDGGKPVGILDWDYAAPGDPLDDIAYALEYVTPFRDDATALRWLAYERPPDRPRRIELFAQAYGRRDTSGLVDRVIDRQRLTIAHVRHLAGLGIEPQAAWIADGSLADEEQRIRWSETHRSLFERAI